MNSHLAPKSVGSCVANLRSRALLRAIRALDPTDFLGIDLGNLQRSELISACLGITLLFFACSGSSPAQEIVDEHVLHQRSIERAVTFLYEVAENGTIEGELLNTTAQRVTDVQVLVRYSWVWARESNVERDDPSWVNTFTFPVDLKPGDSSPLSIPPLRAIESRDDGKFLISAKVMGYTRFQWVNEK